MRWRTTFLLLALAPLAGCLSPNDGGGPATPGANPTDDPVPQGPMAPSAGGGGQPGPGPGDRGTGDGGNGSGGTDPSGGQGTGTGSAPREWAPVGSATIRPGVQVLAEGSQCTSNFLFTSADNVTVYLGF